MEVVALLASPFVGDGEGAEGVDVFLLLEFLAADHVGIGEFPAFAGVDEPQFEFPEEGLEGDRVGFLVEVAFDQRIVGVGTTFNAEEGIESAVSGAVEGTTAGGREDVVDGPPAEVIGEVSSDSPLAADGGEGLDGTGLKAGEGDELAGEGAFERGVEAEGARVAEADVGFVVELVIPAIGEVEGAEPVKTVLGLFTEGGGSDHAEGVAPGIDDRRAAGGFAAFEEGSAEVQPSGIGTLGGDDFGDVGIARGIDVLSDGDGEAPGLGSHAEIREPTGDPSVPADIGVIEDMFRTEPGRAGSVGVVLVGTDDEIVFEPEIEDGPQQLWDVSGRLGSGGEAGGDTGGDEEREGRAEGIHGLWLGFGAGTGWDRPWRRWARIRRRGDVRRRRLRHFRGRLP